MKWRPQNKDEQRRRAEVGERQKARRQAKIARRRLAREEKS